MHLVLQVYDYQRIRKRPAFSDDPVLWQRASFFDNPVLWQRASDICGVESVIQLFNYMLNRQEVSANCQLQTLLVFRESVSK